MSMPHCPAFSVQFLSFHSFHALRLMHQSYCIVRVKE